MLSTNCESESKKVTIPEQQNKDAILPLIHMDLL